MKKKTTIKRSTGIIGICILLVCAYQYHHFQNQPDDKIHLTLQKPNERNYSSVIQYDENQNSTEIITPDTPDVEIHRVYDNTGKLKFINHVTDLFQVPTVTKVYDPGTGMDQRWQFFNFKQHLFEKDELKGNKGRDYFVSVCSVCHGASGEGRLAASAPSLAGLPSWYLSRQMEMFVDGRRLPLPEIKHGHSHGNMMIEFLKELDHTQLKTLSDYYSELIPFPIEDRQGGDASKGRAIYTGKGTCISCHQPNGKGNKILGAPPITHIPSWYFLNQMKAFQEGHRGSQTKDASILGMVAAVKNLTDEDFKNLVAYLESIAE